MHFLRDTRAVSAVEFAVAASVMVALLLPITDIGIAALTYISAYQSVRNVADYAAYNPPPDLTAISTNYLQQELPPNTTVIACGDTACTTPPASPTSLLFTKTFTLTPIIFNVGCSAGCSVNYLQPIK